jgi:hypothetical protein
VSNAPYLSITPPQVAFQSVVLGASTSQSFMIQNLGKTDMIILGYSSTLSSNSDLSTNITESENIWDLDLNGFFTTQDLPAIDATIAAGKSFVVHVSFTPNVIGEFHSVLEIWTNGGVQNVLLSGTGSTAPVARLEVSTTEGGWTRIDDCPTVDECAFQIDIGLVSTSGPPEQKITIRFTNYGGSPLIITKSKPPMGVISATNPSTDLSEGMSIQPNASTTAMVLFAPGKGLLNSPPKMFNALWTLNTNDLSFGVHVLNFSAVLVSPQTGPLLNDSSQSRYQYLGCYQDSPNQRIESNSFTDNINMTNGACQTSSLSKSAVFAATEYSKECWYGNLVPLTNLKAPDNMCAGYVCAGDSSQFCGGPGGYMGVFYDVTRYNPVSGWIGVPPGSSIPDGNTPLNTNLSHPDSVKEYSYAGCFVDNQTNRTLNQKFDGGSKTQSLEQCAEFCAPSKYFGTEYAAECFCAEDLPIWATKMTDTDCNMPCSGNETQSCGAAGRLTVYLQQKSRRWY